MLQVAELRELVRDMCIGENHVKYIMSEFNLAQVKEGDGFDGEGLVDVIRSGLFIAFSSTRGTCLF